MTIVSTKINTLPMFLKEKYHKLSLNLYNFNYGCPLRYSIMIDSCKGF